MSNKMFFSPVGGGVNPYLANLVAYYKFDSNSNDFSGNLHNGTSTAISYANGGKVGNSATFNGTSSNISIAHNSDLDFSNGVSNIPFTFSIWLYISDANLRYVLQKGNTIPSLQYDISINPHVACSLYSDSANSGLGRRFTNVPFLNVWENYIITYDGSTSPSGIKLYRNGISDVGVNVSYGTFTKMPTNTDPLIIGKRSFQSAGYYDGRQDEFYIWKNRIITPTEALDIYNKGVAGTALI